MNLMDQSLGQLARQIPGATRVFEAHRVDFCCAGNRTLRTAAAAAGLTPEAALRSFQNDYDKWTALVGRNMGMAQMLGLNGTPSYVVGRDLFPGVTPIPVLRRAVEAARKG